MFGMIRQMFSTLGRGLKREKEGRKRGRKGAKERGERGLLFSLVCALLLSTCPLHTVGVGKRDTY